MKRLISLTTLAAAMLATSVALSQSLPLKTLPDDKDRDHWLPQQVNKDGALEALQAATFV